jgi:hypothetical protein
MITICKACHDNEHTEDRPYSSFRGALVLLDVRAFVIDHFRSIFTRIRYEDGDLDKAAGLLGLYVLPREGPALAARPGAGGLSGKLIQQDYADYPDFDETPQ